MIPNAFDYQRAGSLDEALGLVGSPGTKVIAGGMSLLPLMKLRLANPDKVVDIGRIQELRGVRQLEDGRLAIGALTTYTELLESPARHYGLVRDALPDIGDVQVRNRGTVGGAVAHCDPASDLPAVLLALDAQIVARSKRGEKVYPVDGFFTGAFTTALADDELITEIRLPGPRDDAGSAYRALSQRASGYSIVGVAAVVIKQGGSRRRAVPRQGRRGGAPGQRGHGRGDRRGGRPRDRRRDRQRRHPRRQRVPSRDGGDVHEAGDRRGPGPARRVMSAGGACGSSG